MRAPSFRSGAAPLSGVQAAEFLFSSFLLYFLRMATSLCPGALTGGKTAMAHSLLKVSREISEYPYPMTNRDPSKA